MGIEKSEEKKIVVAIDESEESMYALSWCINNIISLPNQNCSNSTILILLYVKPPPPAYSAFDVAGYLFGNDGVATLENYSRKLVDSVMTKAQKICMESNINIKVEKKVGSGDPKSVICGTVEKLGAHMLVMGSHDYGFFKRPSIAKTSVNGPDQPTTQNKYLNSQLVMGWAPESAVYSKDGLSEDLLNIFIDDH